MTPEGKVKNLVKKLLKLHPRVWWDMPVPSGYGKSTVDFIGCRNGRLFAIETKAPGRHPTPLQRKLLHDINLAGGKTFVIHGDHSPEYERLKDFLRDGIGGEDEDMADEFNNLLNELLEE